MVEVGDAAALLTARYCGVRPPRPVRLPQVVALLSCCICCASCCCRRRCSLSFCVSANFTTMGDEQPCGGEEERRRGGGERGEERGEKGGKRGKERGEMEKGEKEEIRGK